MTETVDYRTFSVVVFHSCIADWSAFQEFFDSSRWWVISWPLRRCNQSDSGVEVMVTSSWHHHSGERIRTRDFMEISCMIEYWYLVTDRSEYRQRTISRLWSILVRLNCGVVGEVHVNDSCCWYLIRWSFQGTRLRSVPVIDYRWTKILVADNWSDPVETFVGHPGRFLLREPLQQSSSSSSHRHRFVGDRFVQSYYRSQVTSSTVDCDC